jgi:Uncharacterized protein conserved in bacteria (DUF2330)
MTKRAALRAAGPALVGLFTLVSRPPVARACAIAPPPGENVHTTREDALIVWDAERHLEHFVRSAVFDTSAASFGFIVPTPSRPTLAEASETVTDLLASLTAPETVHETRYVLAPIGCTMLPFVPLARPKATAAVAAAPTAAVVVLEETRVSGLDAVVLEADDASALADWLRAHGFELRNALKRWVAPYLAKKWKITAFRYARPDLAANVDMHADPIAARAVRLTFATDAPVYPYREPDDVPAVAGRELRLFVLSDEKLDGAFTDIDGAWPATEPFASTVETSRALATALPGVDLPGHPWLHELRDLATSRPASDVVFRPAASRIEVRRPPDVMLDERPIPIPYELPIVVGGVWWWRRRARRSTPPSTSGTTPE